MVDQRGGARIEVEPLESLVGDPVNVVARGLEPGAMATISLECIGEDGVRWESRATYAVPESGVVDPSALAPESGSYSGADPAGLFWSMSPVSELKPGGPFSKDLAGMRITARLDAGGKTVDSREFVRFRLEPWIDRREVRDQGVTGTVFLPEGSDLRPAIIVLGGSEGGTYEPAAAAFASLGFVALALAYFGMEGLPDQLVGVPIETVERAIGWLRVYPRVREDSIGVWGASKGAELALVAASFFPGIRAVVAKSPSAYAFEGISGDFGRKHKSSWTYKGEALPFVPVSFDFRIAISYFFSKLTGKPWATEPMYSYAVRRNARQIESAAIKAERINGPVLLTSGGRDGVWPSAAMASVLMQRLEREGHDFPDVHLNYSGAGHQIGAPFYPTTVNYLEIPGGFVEFLGGSPAANSEASIDSWPKINDFLIQSLNLRI